MHTTAATRKSSNPTEASRAQTSPTNTQLKSPAPHHEGYQQAYRAPLRCTTLRLLIACVCQVDFIDISYCQIFLLFSHFDAAAAPTATLLMLTPGSN